MCNEEVQMNACMKGLALVAFGVVLGSVATERSAAQQAGVRVNHVGISVADMNGAIAFYTKTMGFREAYTLRDGSGNPTMSAIQVSRETFLELTPASTTRPAGFSHVGIEADDIQSTATRLRQAGAPITEPRFAENTGVTLANVTDPQGLRVEILQLNPASLQRKAIDTWK
jgi:catechol 2,3-dioxygenase-like lactoylglutathione lyase family enzyme